MSDIEIRPARIVDLPAITAIYDEAVRFGTATFELTSPDVAEMTRRFESITGGGYPYLVALLDGEIAGYAYASAHRPRPAYRFTVENSIYLAPQTQRRGIGGLLLSHLIHACESHGYRQMVAVIGDSANAGSIALHRKAGFRMIGTHPDVGFKFGRWLDTVSMQLPLGEGARTIPRD